MFKTIFKKASDELGLEDVNLGLKDIGLGLWFVIRWLFIIECVVLSASVFTLWWNDYYNNSTCAIDQFLPNVLGFCAMLPLYLIGFIGIGVIAGVALILILFTINYLYQKYLKTLLHKKMITYYKEKEFPTPSPKVQAGLSIIGTMIYYIGMILCWIIVIVYFGGIVIALLGGLGYLLFGDIC